nr:hypothetical protein [Ruminococcus sp. 1001270H_150608_F2]
MKPNNVIANLNHKVKYTGTRTDISPDKAFIFLGATIRKTKKQRAYDKEQVFYQAELQSEDTTKSLIIVNLDDIERLQND